MSTALVPVDLDAVEERVLPQMTLRGLFAALLAVAVGVLALRGLGTWPVTARVIAASLGAATAWAVPTARLAGATPAQWLMRVGAYAVSSKRLVAGHGSWPGLRP